MVTGQRRKVPAEECAVAVAVNPGEQVDNHVAGFGYVALASGVVEVAGEVAEGGKAAAGFDETLDDVGGFGGSVGIPVIGDGLGDAAELDDGEFAGEPALEGVDAAADFGEGHEVTSGGALQLEPPEVEPPRADPRACGRIGFWDEMMGKFAKILSFPFISVHLSRESRREMGAPRALLGAKWGFWRAGERIWEVVF